MRGPRATRSLPGVRRRADEASSTRVRALWLAWPVARPSLRRVRGEEARVRVRAVRRRVRRPGAGARSRLEGAGQAPATGSIFRNPELATTYARIGGRGADAFYSGKVAAAIVDAVKHPPVAPGATRKVRPGVMETSDLAAYRAPLRPRRGDV